MFISSASPSIDPDSCLQDVLPEPLARRTLSALLEMQIITAEDLYECVANLGSNWFRSFQGIKKEDAAALVDWLSLHEKTLGEVTERFWPIGFS